MSSSAAANGGGGGANNKKKRKAGTPGVRFALDVEQHERRGGDQGGGILRPAGGRGDGGGDGSASAPSAVIHRKKRPRKERPNEDEIDDVDDWRPEDDYDGGGAAGGGGDALPTERDLLKAKRERRLKRERSNADGGGGEVDDEEEEETHVDAATSLASEGVPIEPFNMQQETQDGTGYFDGDTYVFRSGGREQEEPDAWLDSLNEKDGDNSNKKPYAEQEVDDEDEEDDGAENEEKGGDDALDSWTQEELYAKLLPLVSDTETVEQAIRRYGNILKRNAATSANHHNHKPPSSSSSKQQKPSKEKKGAGDSRAAELAQEALNEVTEAASALLLKGQVGIYQKTRNDLMKLLPPAAIPSGGGENGNSQQDPKASGAGVQWEYQGSQDGQVHGPYTSQQMLGWIRAGYFVGASAVKVRTVKEEEQQQQKKKSLQDDLLSDLMEDDDEEEAEGKPAGESATSEKSNMKLVYGDWQMSDKVDFTKYLP